MRTRPDNRVPAAHRSPDNRKPGGPGTPDPGAPGTVGPGSLGPGSPDTLGPGDPEPGGSGSAAPAAPRHHPLRAGIRHLAEMVLAMVAGMVLLDPVWTTFTRVLGGSGALERPDVAALVMATNMTIGMSIWMRHRKHGWSSIAEMGAAMYVPYLLFLGPHWTGHLSGEALHMGGHLLMLPAMVAVMLWRRDEYTHDHRHPRPVRR